jgi:transcriptional regulator with XRE-family HTH domain
MKIGSIVKTVRLDQRLSLRDLGRKVDLLPSTLSRIENGETCDPDAVVKVFLWLITPEKKVA